MLHQTLTPPFVHFHPFSAPASFAPPLAAAVLLHPPPPSPTSQPPLLLRSFQAEREARMEAVEEEVMRKACRAGAEAEQLQQSVFVLPDDVAWAVERGGFNGEDFSVDDLLDFDGLEAEKESEETEAFAFEAADYKTCASTSSAVTFEAPPLAAINLPTHDAAEFEWMSSIIDDCPSEFPPCSSVPPYRPTTQSNTQLPPPPKTLCCTLSTEALVPVKAKRSKRSRTAGSAWPTVGVAALSDTTASSTTTTTTTTTSSSPSSSSCSSSPSYSSYLVTNHVSFLFNANPPPPKKHQPKKRGRKPKNHHHHPPPHTAASAVAGFGERHCTHCGAQKTPQWRTGPLGPKTLCNACGVRFKSGRLMPEYRPAASPTFVSHVHSNSHRKVLEMRRKKEEHHLAATPSF